VLGQAQQRTPLPLLAYCLMPNHFHLVVGPVENQRLSRFMHWLTATHSKRWHSRHATAGTGPVYQGRFKAFPVQTNTYFINVCRYVERNAVRARLVSTAEEWPWSSLVHDRQNGNVVALNPWPIPKPSDWRAFVNVDESSHELSVLRESTRGSIPYGDRAWIDRVLDLGSEPRGRPRVSDPRSP
jgi:putative transposase